jgi:hypothetical protein
MSAGAVFDGAFCKVFDGGGCERLPEEPRGAWLWGGAAPQTPWDLSLCACSSKVSNEEGGLLPARPTLLLASPQIGARVASLRCPILRWGKGGVSRFRFPGGL